jgi:ribonucleoside-diphosphate reductase alpha chain
MVAAEELEPEDKIAVLNSPAEFSNAVSLLPVSSNFEDYRALGDRHTPILIPSEWSEELAELVGYLVGDGCIWGGVASWIYGNETDKTELYPQHKNWLYKLTGLEPQKSEMDNGTWQMRLSRMPWVRFLKALGVREAKAPCKEVPWSIFQAPTPIVASFLRGLFTADGCVVEQPSGTRYVGLSSKSTDLLQSVQILLSTFGIFSRIYSNDRSNRKFDYIRKDGTYVTYNSTGNSYDLRISGRSIRKFFELIGFATSAKQDKLAAIVKDTEYYQTDESVRLVSFEPDGFELTYNLAEPKNHSYVANGLVAANCSEFMFLDETACNLASLNLMKFRKLDGSFDIEKFERAVEIFIMAQEIIVDNASYPTAKIAEKSHEFRPLGLGYANLGALIMSMGLPYDSDQGRAYAAAITAIMTGHAYYMSSQVAKAVGAFEGYQLNRDPMLRVIRMHREAAYKIDSENCSEEIYRAACDVWDRALESGIEYGYKNSQVTVLAPTGTISFMMDCDTTGIEPDIALVKYKLLAGGGLLKIVNRTVPEALAKLGYTEKQIDDIIKHIEKQDTIEGAPHLKDEQLPVFDCAFKPFNGTRAIQHMAHLKMMAAVQPFLSGAISKTINMPKESSVEDIMEAYIEGWKLGLKAVAIYRDGSKRSQPLSTSLKPEESAPKPVRKRLPATRNSITHKFEIQGHEGYFTVGFYEDGSPGELFITMAKEGSTIGGLMDAFGTAISLGLQYGVPLKALVDKFVNSHFEPSGYTSNSEIPLAKSIVDYIFRWLGIHFVEGYAELMSKTAIEASLAAAEGQVQAQALKPDASTEADKSDKSDKLESESKSAPNGAARKIKRIDEQFAHFQDDAPICDSCGAITVRNGACYKCYNCGNAIGCS